MIPLTVTMDLDKTPWSDLPPAVKKQPLGRITRVGRLTSGTASGKSVVVVAIQMPDGSQFLAQTTMDLFHAAGRAFKAIEEEMSGSNARN